MGDLRWTTGLGQNIQVHRMSSRTKTFIPLIDCPNALSDHPCFGI